MDRKEIWKENILLTKLDKICTAKNQQSDT